MPTTDAMLKIARLDEQTGGPHLPFHLDHLHHRRKVSHSAGKKRHSHFVEDRKAGEYVFVVDSNPPETDRSK